MSLLKVEFLIFDMVIHGINILHYHIKIELVSLIFKFPGIFKLSFYIIILKKNILAFFSGKVSDLSLTSCSLTFTLAFLCFPGLFICFHTCGHNMDYYTFY